jgi:hypothetical protein
VLQALADADLRSTGRPARRRPRTCRGRSAGIGRVTRRSTPGLPAHTDIAAAQRLFGHQPAAVHRILTTT